MGGGSLALPLTPYKKDGGGMTKKAALYAWMLMKPYFYTHEVLDWGLRHFYTSADRMKRILMEEGKVRKLTDNEREELGLTARNIFIMAGKREAVYTARPTRRNSQHELDI